MDDYDRRSPPRSPVPEELRWFPALAAGLASAVLVRLGMLAVFFLVPLAFTASGFNGKTAWTAALAAALGNLLCSLGLSVYGVLDGGAALGDLLFISLIMAIFTGLVAPPALAGRRLKAVPGAYRLLGGAVLGVLAFLLMLNLSPDRGDFYASFRSQAERLSSALAASLGTDAVRRNLVEEYLSAEAIVKAFTLLTLRGGALASVALIFFMSSRFGRALARIFLRREEGPPPPFHALPVLIWVFSGTLVGILLSRLGQLEFLEIVLWNILILCSMLYLAQGWEIMAFFLARAPVPPFLRIVVKVALILFFLRPGFNVVIPGLLVLLGIAENWVPFRAYQSKGPPPTPGA
jgi:hypothetical protein